MVEQDFLDGDQQVIGEHAEEDVSFGAAFGVVEDRPLGERRFHVTEGGFGAGEQNVDAPELVAGEVLAIGLDQIAAVELLGPGMFGRFELADDRRGLRVMGDAEVARDARIALLQPSDRLVDLGGLDELSVSDAARRLSMSARRRPSCLARMARSLAMRCSLRHST